MKPETDFTPLPNNKKSRKFSYYCRPCDVERQMEWRAKNPEKARIQQKKASLKTLYGIELEDYAEMMEAQEGVCAICSEACPTGRDLAVDHDEETGDIRGLLCANCNRGIGLLKHDLDRILNAFTYLSSAKYIPRRVRN